MRPDYIHGFVLLSIAALTGGCAVSTSVTGPDRRPLGTIEVTSATFGNVTLTPATCASGAHQIFLGADFVDRERGAVVRLIVQPTGEATLRVFSAATPLDAGIVAPRAACSKFLVSLERTAWTIDDIHDLRVSLDVDCRTASGDTIQGMVSAAHCH